jgi:hypothetical protein
MKEHVYPSEDLILCQKCATNLMYVKGDFPHYCYGCKKKQKIEQTRILSWFKVKVAP